MNKISATGRLAADAEVRYTNAGDPICGFRMASDVGFGDKKTTNWFTCSIFGKRGESLAPHLTKGLPVTVFGTFIMREWEDKDGAKKLSPDIRIDEIELQGGKRESASEKTGSHENAGPRNAAAVAASKKPTPNFSEFDDDIPF